MNKLVEVLYKIAKKLPIVNKFVTKEILRFLFIGSTSFIISYSVNTGLLLVSEKIFNYDEGARRGAIVIIVYLIAYLIAFIYNFTLSRNWTFQEQIISKDIKHKVNKHILKFLLVNTFNAILGALVIALLDQFGIPPYISQPFFIAAQTIWTYFLYKFWVFS